MKKYNMFLDWKNEYSENYYPKQTTDLMEFPLK